MRDELETFNFVVVCAKAESVYLMGDFNGWSSCATPMAQTEPNVWEAALTLPKRVHRFAYFVIDSRFGSGLAAFGNTYLVPGTWAAVLRNRCATALSVLSLALHLPSFADSPLLELLC